MNPFTSQETGVQIENIEVASNLCSTTSESQTSRAENEILICIFRTNKCNCAGECREHFFLNVIFSQQDKFLMLHTHYSLPYYQQHLNPFDPSSASPCSLLSPFISAFINYSIYWVSADTTPTPPALQGSGKAESNKPLRPCFHSQDDK